MRKGERRRDELYEWRRVGASQRRCKANSNFKLNLIEQSNLNDKFDLMKFDEENFKDVDDEENLMNFNDVDDELENEFKFVFFF